MGLYEEISANKRNSYFLIFLFCLIIIGLGFVIGYIFLGSYIAGMILAFAIAIIYSLIAFYSGDKMILKMSHAKEVSKKDDPFLVNTVEGLAMAAGFKKSPKVYIMKEESSNAFAAGRSPETASITVTSGLREKLNRVELEGVIAHEMSHIKNYDIRFMMLVAVMLGLVALLSHFILYSFLWGGAGRSRGRSNGGGGGIGIIIILVGLALAILAPIVAQLIRFAVSRKREYLADANAAMLTRHPPGLANALKKIRDDHDKVVDTANKAMAHLFIEDPLRHKEKTSFVDRMFMTHPPINDRIKKLESM